MAVDVSTAGGEERRGGPETLGSADPGHRSAADAPTVTQPGPRTGLDRRLATGRLRRLTDAVVALPDRVVYSFLLAAIPVGLCVVFRVFTPLVVLPLCVVAVALGWRWTPSRFLDDVPVGIRWLRRGPTPEANGATAPGPRRATAVFGSALAVLGVLGWVYVNRGYVSGNVVLERDPGIYTLRALWLIDHPTPLIDSTFEASRVAGIPGVQVGSLAFEAVNGTIYPQSFSLLPGLLAVAGWAHGLRGVLLGNLLIGGIALLSVYAFARRLIGPMWALVPMAALAASIPMVAFSRGTYSEPVALAATYAGLTLLWVAWQSGRMPLFFVAGLLVGVSSLARIDGGVTVIGILVGFGVVTAFARDRALRRRAALAATLWAVGAGLLYAVSIVDGLWNTPSYFAALARDTYSVLAGAVLVYVLVVAVAFVPLGPVRRALGAGHRSWGRWVLGAALLIGAVMISRPLWWVSRQASDAMTGPISGMQTNAGFVVDKYRTYDESTVSWMAMYLGWLTVLLAAIGAALLLARMVRDRDPRIAVFVMTVGCVAGLYLNKVSIFPDQVWAMRRFLPVVLPGLLIAAAYVLFRLEQRARQWAAVLGFVGAVVVMTPMVLWGSNWAVANQAAQPDEMRIACQFVGDRAVVVAGPDAGAAHFLPTFKIGCGRPTVSYPKPTQQGLAQLNTALVDPSSGRPPVLVTFDPASVPWVGDPPPPTISTALTKWDQPLQQAPTGQVDYQRQMYLGTITPDGLVQPLSG